MQRSLEDSYMWKGVSLGCSQREGTRCMTCRVCTYLCRRWGRRIQLGSSCSCCQLEDEAGCSGRCPAGCDWTQGWWPCPPLGWLCPGPGPCCSPRRSRQWRPGGCKKGLFRRTGLSLGNTIRLMASWQDDRWLSENRNSLLLHCLPVGRHPSKRNRQINIGFFYWVHHRLGSEAASKSAHWDQSYYRQMSLYMYTMVYGEVVHKQIVQKFSNF